MMQYYYWYNSITLHVILLLLWHIREKQFGTYISVLLDYAWYVLHIIQTPINDMVCQYYEIDKE